MLLSGLKGRCVPLSGLKGRCVPLSGVSGIPSRQVIQKQISFPGGFHPGSFHGSARQTANPSMSHLSFLCFILGAKLEERSGEHREGDNNIALML